MSVDTVIVNFRTPELTFEAVRSVVDEPETASVIVVENGSGDSSAEWLAQRLEPPARLMQSERNLGFGGGNNLGIEAARAEYVFLLNSDAQLRPGGLASMLERMSDQSVGIVAPAIYLPDGRPQADVIGRFPTPSRILTRRTDCSPDLLEPDWVSGCAMLLRRTEMIEIGGFDEGLFMYLEDVDLCKRYRDRGFRIVRDPSAGVVHLGGGSRASSRSQKEQFRQSMDRYLEKQGFSLASRAAVRAARSIYSRLRGL